MTINWFPGHMHKARREIGKAMPRVSLIMEILDARIPFSSENPLVAELRGDTPCIKVLNKSDLADPQATRAWLTHFEQIPGVTAIALDARQAGRVKSLPELGRRLLPGDRSPGKPVTTMILGIPNVGKSTLINTLAGRSIAKTGNVPAVTRAQQRIKISDNFVLLDTPGFLWPKLTPQECGYRLAVTGAIRDAVIEYEDIAFFAAKYLLERYPDALAQRYDLEVIPEDEMGLMEAVGARRGCLGRGGTLNLHKVCEILIRELRQGVLGPISLETPHEIAQLLERHQSGTEN